jgi:hypothetical protein
LSRRFGVLLAYFAIYGGIVLYHYAIKNSPWPDSAALFIGLPALLAILVAQIPTKSVTAYLLVALTLLLLLAVPILREGTVCVIMAAPLMYAVVGVIGVLIDWISSRSNRLNASIAAVILSSVLSLEGVIEATTFERHEEVATTRLVEGRPEAVMARFTADPAIPTTLPNLFNVGFPRPYEFNKDGTGIGSHFSLSFIKNQKVKTITYELTEATSNHLAFKVVEDKTAITKWMHLRKTVFTFTPMPDGRTQVTCAISFDRKLDPAWYFAPIMRYSIGLVGDLLLDHFDAEPPVVGSL